MSVEFILKGKVEIAESERAAWHMIYLPKGLSQGIRKLFQGLEGGFGSLPVEVTIGKTSWRTSIFSESKDGKYLLLIKAAVRKKENIKAGDRINFKLNILV